MIIDFTFLLLCVYFKIILGYNKFKKIVLTILFQFIKAIISFCWNHEFLHILLAQFSIDLRSRLLTLVLDRWSLVVAAKPLTPLIAFMAYIPGSICDARIMLS